MYTVYIVRCADDTLYTGYTNDIEMRIKKHNGELSGGAKYTRAKGPVELVYRESSDTKSDALKREHAIKQLSREEKVKLIESACK